MAMMASGPGGQGGNPYDDRIEQDLIDPDDVGIDDLDDPLSTSARTPLTGNMQSSSSRNPLPQNYLNNSISGEDRRAPQNTIDESVWDTLSRDLWGSWEKMRLVLWPKYLVGGMLMQKQAGASGLERGEAGGLAGGLRGLTGRLPDADDLLQGAVHDGLRDWDLWGPLVFSLLLSLLLSFHALAKQKEMVFTGVFSMVCFGTLVVTWQIRLLGGKIAFFQTVSIIGYTLFPLVIASLLSAVGLPAIPRIPVYIVLVLWSLAAGVSILGGSGVVRNRVGLAVYPLFVFYVGLGCLCFIS
ncbi:hypothetical protein MMC25_001537 [Agyrium rufum]|nr:hypothetical protein [Agyrium rufum]